MFPYLMLTLLVFNFSCEYKLETYLKGIFKIVISKYAQVVLFKRNVLLYLIFCMIMGSSLSYRFDTN